MLKRRENIKPAAIAAAIGTAAVAGFLLLPAHRTVLLAARFFLAGAGGLSAAAAAGLLLSRASPRRLLGRFFFPLLAALTALSALPFARLAAVNLGSPVFIIDHWEKTLYFQALEFSETGRAPYRSPEELPLISDNYPPLFPAVSAALFRFFRPAPLIPKLLALAGFLGTLLLLARTLKKHCARDGLWLGIFVFLTVSAAFSWLWARTDPLVSLLTLAFLAIAENPRKRGAPAAAGLLWLAAVYTKQTAALWLPFLAGAVYFREKSLKKTAVFAVLAVAAAAAVFLLIELQTEGWFSFWIVRVPGRHPYHRLGRLAGLTAFRLLTRLGVVPIALALAAALSSRRNRRDGGRNVFREDRALTYWGAASLYGVVVSLLTSLKTGTAYNQYQEVFAPVAVAAAVLFSILAGERAGGRRTPGPSRPFSAGGYCLLLAALLFSAGHSYFQDRANYLAVRFKTAVYPPGELRELKKEIRERGWNRVYFPMSLAPDRSRVLVGIQEYFTGTTDWRIYADEGALMDLRGAGFDFPEGFTGSLRRGEIEQIVVRTSHRVFELANPYARGPADPRDPDLFPPEVRETFAAFFTQTSLETPGFDAYVYVGFPSGDYE